MTTKTRIITYLKDRPGWASGTELEQMARAWETKGSTISRRLRELADDGAIERQLGFKSRVQYRWLTPITIIAPTPLREQAQLFNLRRTI